MTVVKQLEQLQRIRSNIGHVYRAAEILHRELGDFKCILTSNMITIDDEDEKKILDIIHKNDELLFVAIVLETNNNDGSRTRKYLNNGTMAYESLY